MSKKPKSPKRAPPRFRRVIPGQIWLLQKSAGNPVLTALVSGVTRETVLLTWQDDGAIRVKADALPMRYARSDLKFLEKVA